MTDLVLFITGYIYPLRVLIINDTHSSGNNDLLNIIHSDNAPWNGIVPLVVFPSVQVVCVDVDGADQVLFNVPVVISDDKVAV